MKGEKKMKKILSVVVVFAMLAASTAAFAEEPTTRKNADGSYTTDGSDSTYAGSMMTILAYTEDPENQTISVDSIQYIDQTTADANGAYTFANYIPKTTPTGDTTFVVKVGGQNVVNGPLSAGTISPEVSSFVVSGTVTFKGTNTPATVTFADPAGLNAAITATTQTDGTFTVNVPAGTYNLTITKPGHTKYIYNNITVSADATGGSYTLYNGDANGDGIVGVVDVAAVIAGFNAEVTVANKAKDVNDDNVIGVVDVAAVIGNFNRADTNATPAS